jgi:selenide,water dikinase
MFQETDFPNLLVGLGSPDDAAVWKLDEDRALVATTDFFTPVVDEPYDYGSIAAANALSDVYAMGGQPFLALNLAALPPSLPPEITGQIFRGGAEKVRQAGVVLAGGHTIQDQEPKFGLVVLGFVHPDRMLTKSGARPGDLLVMSKPLGFGTLTTALKRGLAEPQDVAEAVTWMKKLNREAALLAGEFGLQGGTDITGFSLLGHALEMAEASHVRLHFSFNKIPFISCARRYADEWIFPGGSSDNRLHFGPQVDFATGIDEVSQMLLFDAQTSGGLLLSVPPERLPAFAERAEALHQPIWVVGEVSEGRGIQVTL